MPKIVWCINRATGLGPVPFFAEDVEKAKKDGFEPTGQESETTSEPETPAAAPAEPAPVETHEQVTE